MKTLPPALQAHLDGGVTTLCWCWKLTRRDDAVLGFTDHDRTLVIDGVAYEAASGFTAGEIDSALGLAVDTLAAAGALSSDRLSEDDLAAGLWDDADVEIWRVNWADTAQRALIKRGSIGEVKRGRLAFEAELRGLAHRLNQTQGRVFAWRCDADLGDARCTVDLDAPAFKGSGTVLEVLSARRWLRVSGLSAFDPGWFTGGRLVFTSGANADAAAEVKRHWTDGADDHIALFLATAFDIAPGDAFTVTAGCDKSFSTCKARFSNGANFRGFPHMPGNDVVVSYPGESVPMDGGSLYGN